MIIPLVLGALGLVALLASNKKPANGASSDSLALLPQGLNGMAKQAIATNDPQTLNTAADALDAQGFHAQAELLRRQASSSSSKGGPQLPEAMKVLMAQALSALTVSASGQIQGPVTAQGIQIASAASAQLRAAGFTEAANSLDVFIARAQAVVPPATPDKQLPLPGLDPALAAQVNQAIATVRDPQKLRQLIAILKGLPPAPQTTQAITTLTALADQLDAAIAASQAMQQINQVTNQQSAGQPQLPGNVNVIPSGPIPVPAVPVPGQSPAAKSKQQILAEGVASGLVRLQNAAAGNVKKVQGKEDKASITRFQAQEKLTQDGKAGPGTTLALAKYTGQLPLVMYWPQKSNAQSVFAYRAKLQDLADAADAAGNPQMGSDLRASAAAERGQGGIVGTMPA